MTTDATYPFGLFASIMCSCLVCLVSLLCHIPRYPVLCTSMYFYTLNYASENLHWHCNILFALEQYSHGSSMPLLTDKTVPHQMHVLRLHTKEAQPKNAASLPL